MNIPFVKQSIEAWIGEARRLQENREFISTHIGHDTESKLHWHLYALHEGLCLKREHIIPMVRLCLCTPDASKADVLAWLEAFGVEHNLDTAVLGRIRYPPTIEDSLRRAEQAQLTACNYLVYAQKMRQIKRECGIEQTLHSSSSPTTEKGKDKAKVNTASATQGFQSIDDTTNVLESSGEAASSPMQERSSTCRSPPLLIGQRFGVSTEHEVTDTQALESAASYTESVRSDYNQFVTPLESQLDVPLVLLEDEEEQGEPEEQQREAEGNEDREAEDEQEEAEEEGESASQASETPKGKEKAKKVKAPATRIPGSADSPIDSLESPRERVVSDVMLDRVDPRNTPISKTAKGKGSAEEQRITAAQASSSTHSITGQLEANDATAVGSMIMGNQQEAEIKPAPSMNEKYRADEPVMQSSESDSSDNSKSGLEHTDRLNAERIIWLRYGTSKFSRIEALFLLLEDLDIPSSYLQEACLLLENKRLDPRYVLQLLPQHSKLATAVANLGPKNDHYQRGMLCLASVAYRSGWLTSPLFRLCLKTILQSWTSKNVEDFDISRFEKLLKVDVGYVYELVESLWPDFQEFVTSNKPGRSGRSAHTVSANTKSMQGTTSKRSSTLNRSSIRQPSPICEDIAPSWRKQHPQTSQTALTTALVTDPESELRSIRGLPRVRSSTPAPSAATKIEIGESSRSSQQEGTSLQPTTGSTGTSTGPLPDVDQTEEASPSAHSTTSSRRMSVIDAEGVQGSRSLNTIADALTQPVEYFRAVAVAHHGPGGSHGDALQPLSIVVEALLDVIGTLKTAAET